MSITGTRVCYGIVRYPRLDRRALAAPKPVVIVSVSVSADAMTLLIISQTSPCAPVMSYVTTAVETVVGTVSIEIVLVCHWFRSLATLRTSMSDRKLTMVLVEAVTMLVVGASGYFDEQNV